MKIPKLAWIAGGVALVAAAVYFSSLPAAVPVRTARPSRGPATAYVEERAVTSLPSISKITMPFDGRILPIGLADGDAVKKGQTVASLDSVDLLNWQEQAVQMAECMNQATLASAATVSSSTEQYNYSLWWMDAQKAMFAKKTIAEKDLRSSILTYQESWDHFNKATREENATKAMYSLCKLFEIYTAPQVRLATLVSPVDGVVLKRFYSNSLVLNAGTLLMEIGDLDALQVTSDILTTQAADIRPGNKVQILDLPTGPLAGTVARIKHMGFTKTSSLGIEEQRIPVDIAFADGDLAKVREAGIPIGVAWRVRVHITTAEKNDALSVPVTALIRCPDGTSNVFVVRNGKAAAVKVATGLSNPETIEITSGLADGENVILAPPAILTDGAPVTVVNSSAGS
jgi:HlyD family secretion protein